MACPALSLNFEVDEFTKQRGQATLHNLEVSPRYSNSLAMKDTRFAKLVLFVNGLVPLTLLLWDVYRKQVGANPL